MESTFFGLEGNEPGEKSTLFSLKSKQREMRFTFIGEEFYEGEMRFKLIMAGFAMSYCLGDEFWLHQW
jgi:hypothetical protein